MSRKIVVVGSCMMDFISYAPQLPQEGETIHGTKFVTAFGGKGANQCVAAARLGGDTTLVARVGDDGWGEKYLENLEREKIATDFVWRTPNVSSGIAQIVVSENGQNQIVIVAGANSQLSAEDVGKVEKLIETAAVVVLQLEARPEVAIKAMQLCRGVSILNGAPALSDYDPQLLKLPTIFCVNEMEAAVFTGLSVNTLEEAKTAAKHLISLGCNSVVLTLGVDGAIYVDRNKLVVHVPCPKVHCLDSVGAGDAFIGALSFLIANHQLLPMAKMIEVACHVASDSVQRPGTQTSFPSKEVLSKYPELAA